MSRGDQNNPMEKIKRLQAQVDRLRADLADAQRERDALADWKPFADEKERAKWWVINAGSLMDVMRLVYIGEDPELLYIELVANAQMSAGGGGTTEGDNGE